LSRFRDTPKAAFFDTPPLFLSKFQGVPLGEGPGRLGVQRANISIGLGLGLMVKLFCKNSRIPTYVITIPQRHRQTDGQTDGRTICCSNTALWVAPRIRAHSRGKKIILDTTI